MTLPDPEVLSLLESSFVVGWKNIRKEDHVGFSHGYTPKQSCVGTTNGAGARNVQILVLSPDRVVLHALPGFWHPQDLARELRFALVLARLWQDDQRTREQKEDMFRRLHRAELRRQPAATYARSGWQHFDRSAELRKLALGERDTFFPGTANGKKTGVIKPVNVLVHERMAKQPFVPLAKFDIEAFSDLGQYYYDNNRRLGEKGVKFRGQSRLRARRATESAKQRRVLEKRKQLEQRRLERAKKQKALRRLAHR